MKISVNCPSYKRPKVKTLQYLPFCKVWVDEGEYPDYIKENKGFETNIVSCPKGIQGNLCRIRNYILDQEFAAGVDVVLIIDDDLEGVYLFQGTKEMPYQREKIMADEFLQFIEKYSILCDGFGFKFWGCNCNSDNLSYRQFIPFSTCAYIGGPFQCFLKNPLRYDETLPLKEDYDMTLQQCNEYRGCLRVNFAHYICQQAEQAGGCATYRNREREYQQLRLLRKKWGSRIVRFDESKNTKCTKERKYEDFNPIIKIPIKGV